jgi:hypothetical protein
MAKNGLRAFDSDMHMFEPADLYTKYMDPKWGERIPRGERRKEHGMTRYFLCDGQPIWSPSDVVTCQRKVENRYGQAARTAIHDAYAWTPAKGDIENWTYPLFQVIAVFLFTALIGCAQLVERPKEQEVSRTKQEEDRKPSSTPTFTYRPGSGLMIEGR